MTTTTIGLVPLTVTRQAEAYVLEAVRVSDCKVDELVTKLCEATRPRKVAAEMEELAAEISRDNRVIPQLTHLDDVLVANGNLKARKERYDELAGACRTAARQLITRLAKANRIVVDGDIVRARAE